MSRSVAWVDESYGRIMTNSVKKYIIPYKNVCQIGDDIILVCIDDKCLAKKRDLKDKMRDNFFGF